MKRRKLLTIVLTMVCSIFLYSNLLGQSPAKKIDIAEISNNGTSVSWLIKAPNDGGTLTVSTPSGEVFEMKFDAGSVPSFSPTNKRGEYYGDGQYSYQIVLNPVISTNAKAAMEQSRIDGNSDQVAAELRKSGQSPPEMVESGTFTFSRGTLITGDDSFVQESENVVRSVGPKAGTKTPNTKTPANVPNARRDVPTDGVQVIAQDLVVQGSECVGTDCNSNESFGFDTLRLKENNLRIKFQDTSSSASFPTNDWEITINDSTNGGQNHFSVLDVDNGRVPFTIENTAATNSIYVDGGNSGRVGFKTATPVVELHVRDGDSPTLRLEQDGSSGFQSQTWDIAGNETNFFIRDVTNGSRLPFKIRPGAPTDSLVVEANGNVTINNDINVNGGGTSTTAPSVAQQFYGGNSIVIPGGITPVVDINSFGIGTNGQAGAVALLTNIPSNSNLAATNLPNIVYKIRYRDQDGNAGSANVLVSVVATNINNGSRSTNIVFNSNSDAATGFNTVTVCQAVGANFFDYDTYGTHFFVVLTGTAARNADFVQIQAYRISGSC